MTAMRTRGLLAISALAAIGAGLFLAAPDVHADTNDDAFVAALEMQGIIFHGTRAQEIQAGHEICSLRAKGLSENTIENLLIKSANVSAYSAGYIVGAAETAFCPAYYYTGPSATV